MPSSPITDVYTTVPSDTTSMVSPARYSAKVKTWSDWVTDIGAGGVLTTQPNSVKVLSKCKYISICDAKESPLDIEGIIDNAISSIKMCFILQNVLHKNNTPI